MAALNGQSIRSLMLDKLELPEEEEDEWQPLRELLLDRIRRAETEPVCYKTITELFEEKVAEMRSNGLLDDDGNYIGPSVHADKGW